MKRVVITGMGTICPIGNNTKEMWESILNNKSGIDYIKGNSQKETNVKIAAEIKNIKLQDYLIEREIHFNSKYINYAKIASKEAFLDTPNYDTARVAAQVVSGISFIGGGIIFMRDKRVSGLTTASGIWATAGIGLAIGGGFWFFGAVCSAIIVIVQKLAYEPLLQRKSRQVNIYCEIPNPTIVQSIYNYCHFGDYQSVQVEARELDDEKYELVIRIQNDEEIVIENLKNYIRETENQVVIKRVKLRTEDVN